MECRRFISQLESYLDDRLQGEQRREFRDHLRSCPSCRRAAVAADPVLLLTAAEPREAEPEQVQGCVDAVRALIRQDRLQRRIDRPGRRWLMAAAAVVVAAGGSLLWWSGRPDLGGAGLPQGDGGAAVATRVVAPPPPRIEVDSGDDGEVRVYQYADAGDENTAVIYIVNESMEL
jgi:predicted anti-sigma-YlaC factor YlaD